ncbi:hypothetical protein HYH02_005597 [Chlamydomonas schloesseri]|uniref:Nitroreductase domain-containing protein n=1 Tax=Chlamydomonas schloesseri TaxID=2026947 RepID=A0A836B742_9CHLO|nr:hypothetical protein HYH02_005597 [Chlamydomonas schloesseri]|eukprot:KAG2449450.1 hypothetical protein HYH02_005597 [Chlamydomonas schloesseri]
MECRPASSMRSELAVLLLLAVSGAAGLATANVAITATMFVGGITTWLFLTLPDYLKAARDAKTAAGEPAKQEQEQKQQVDGKKAEAGGLPSPESVLALIRKRRSIFPKDYNGHKVAHEQIKLLIEAANWAPTHGQTEPWRFVVLEGGSKKAMEELTMELCRTRLPADKAAKTMEKLEKKRDSTWGKVSCYIAICCKRQAKPDKLMPEWEEMAATSAAAQNMWLMSTALGLAAYWTSWQEVAREAPEMKQLLGLAPEDRVLGFFTVGLAEPERVEGYRAARGPAADKVTWRD